MNGKSSLVTRSRTLLLDVLDSRELTRDELCKALHLSDDEMQRVLDGTSVLSQARQLLLGALIVERVPRLASKGYALRAQAIAAIAVEERQTQTHSAPWK